MTKCQRAECERATGDAQDIRAVQAQGRAGEIEISSCGDVQAHDERTAAADGAQSSDIDGTVPEGTGDEQRASGNNSGSGVGREVLSGGRTGRTLTKPGPRRERSG